MANPSNYPEQYSIPDPTQENEAQPSTADAARQGSSFYRADTAVLDAPTLDNPQEVISPLPEDDWSSLTQEIVDTMPRVWTRSLLYLLALFAVTVLPWTMFSRVDEVGSATGKLEPKGKVVRLDASVTGTVQQVRVKEGETLKAGQPLIKLESELTVSELQQAQAELEGQRNRLSQLEFMKNQLLEVTVRAQQEQGRADAASLLAQIDQTRRRLTHSQTMRGIAANRLQRDLVEVERYRNLVKQGALPVIRLTEAQKPVDETRWNLNQAESDIRQAESQIEAQENQYQSALQAAELTVLETQRRTKELESQITELSTAMNRTQKQIESLKFQLQQREVRSPIDGVLYRLPIQQAGAVVAQGETVAQIAPANSPLVLRANMRSQESGFLKVGMPVKIKFDAYPYQDYGVLNGTVAWVSPNSKVADRASAPVETFEIEVLLEKPYLKAANKYIQLKPGQTATAEVIVRQRRLMDYLLDPFKKLQEGGLEL